MNPDIEQWFCLTDEPEIFFNRNILTPFIYAVRRLPSWNSKEPVGSERLSIRKGVKQSQRIEDADY